jgi:phosphohistidine phosphatase
MELYLLRHGHAGPGHPDADRTLTPEGVAALERVAARAGVAGVRLRQIYHSGYVRAAQTAEILAARLGAAGRVGAREGLAPDDTVAPVAGWLLDPVMLDDTEGLALVGHLPFLPRLTARLLGLSDGGAPVVFEPATLVKLVPRSDRAGYAIAWVLPPDLA